MQSSVFLSIALMRSHAASHKLWLADQQAAGYVLAAVLDAMDGCIHHIG